MPPLNVNNEHNLRESCAAALRSVPTDLNFSLGGHQVSFQNLQSVAKDIMSGLLKVVFYDLAHPAEDGFGRTALPVQVVLRPNIVAWYEAKGQNNQKSLSLTKIPITVPDKAIVVHECVHALLHKQGGSIYNRTNECAAYIAEGWYLWRKGGSPAAGDSRTRLAIRTAQHIYLMMHAQTLSHTNEAFRAFQKKYPLSWEKMLELKLKQLYHALIHNLQENNDYPDLDKAVTYQN